jgi:hypothetical protein
VPASFKYFCNAILFNHYFYHNRQSSNNILYMEEQGRKMQLEYRMNYWVRGDRSIMNKCFERLMSIFLCWFLCECLSLIACLLPWQWNCLSLWYDHHVLTASSPVSRDALTHSIVVCLCPPQEALITKWWVALLLPCCQDVCCKVFSSSQLDDEIAFFFFF